MWKLIESNLDDRLFCKKTCPSKQGRCARELAAPYHTDTSVWPKQLKRRQFEHCVLRISKLTNWELKILVQQLASWKQQATYIWRVRKQNRIQIDSLAGLAPLHDVVCMSIVKPLIFVMKANLNEYYSISEDDDNPIQIEDLFQRYGGRREIIG